MKADAIRSQFSTRAALDAIEGQPDDKATLILLTALVVAAGEIAAQLAEFNEKRPRV